MGDRFSNSSQVSQYASVLAGSTKPFPLRLAGRLWRHLHSRRRRQLGLLGVLVGLSALFEVASLGALLPFLQVLVAPDQVLDIVPVRSVASMWGITTADQIVLPLAVLFGLVAVGAAVLRLAVLWSSSRLAHAISGDLGIEVYRRTLYQAYPVQIARNSSTVLAGITHTVSSASKMLVAQLNLATDAVVLFGIASVLLAVHPLAASISGVVFGASYAVVYRTGRRRLILNGQIVVREQTSIIKVVQEGLGAIRDVLLDWSQPVYVDVYRRASAKLRRASGDSLFIIGAPRSVVEAVGIVLIVGLATWLSRTDGGLNAALPVLGVLALGAQRLLPVMQQAYNSWGTITFQTIPVSEMLDMLDQPLPPELHLPPRPPLQFNEEIRFENVQFRYSEDGPLVLDGLNLSIPRGVRIGIVGETGTGKSTLLDLLVGLLEPTSGSVAVDGLSIAGARLRSWQSAVAHVPQSIFLADSTIAENIAFGMPFEAIDMNRVRAAAADAQIADFVDSLPLGYSTVAGERGIRLSGGQRQRIGIARALHKRASVLVLDEATSALDNATERSVMDTVERLNRDLTIIVIAHRLTTMRRCDRIVELSSGRAVEYQSYEDMLARSPSARNQPVEPTVDSIALTRS